MMYDFSQSKFLSLPVERQHKKCAELLHSLYSKMISNEEIEKDLNLYHKLASWMNEKGIIQANLQSLSDRYHWHLQKGHIYKKEHHLLPEIRKGDREHALEYWPIAIYLDHIRSAHNVGSLLRTTEALRLGSVYFSEHTPFIDHKQVQNTARGAHNWVECYQGHSLSDLIRPLIVLETSEEAISLYDFIFPPSFTLVVGNEEYGCSESSLKCADYFLEIPLRGRKNSLNVANAFALVAGEIVRQKNLLNLSENKK